MTDTSVATVPFAGAAPAKAFAALPAESLAEGIGSSYAIIGYKGKVWSLRYRGEKHTFVRDDDGSPMSYIDVIILRSPAVKSKSYYSREDGFDPNSNDGKRPLCASLDGVTPDTDIAVPQSRACATCPRNEWKTDANGKKTRDCADAKRLAVLILPAQTAKLLGSPLLEPTFLRVPPASLNDLAAMGEMMDKQGWPYCSFITRVSFDPEQPHPKMIFRPIQQLTDAEAPVVLGMRDDPMALRITGEDVIGRRPLSIAPPGPPAPVAPPAPPVGPVVPPVAPPAPVPAPVAAPAPVVPLATGLGGLSPTPPPPAAPVVPAATVAPVAAVVPPAIQAAPAPAPAPVSPSSPAVGAVVDTGFGLSPGAVTATVTPLAAPPSGPLLNLTAAPPGPAEQTADDVGAASESDLDLDARVAKLLEVA